MNKTLRIITIIGAAAAFAVSAVFTFRAARRKSKEKYIEAEGEYDELA